MRLVILVSAYATLVACDPDVSAVREEVAVLRSMPHDHAVAARLRDAVVHGDLPAAREEARSFLAGLGPAPVGTEAERAALVAAVEEVRAATDLATAARGAGRMAVACGSCHAITRPRIAAPTATPVPGDGVRAEMARHSDALALLWSGLIRPSASDLEGAAALFDAGLFSPVGGASPEAISLDEQVSTKAREIAAAPDAEARAQRTGELLATCAACHTARPGGVVIEPE